jgi:hypothetical protein
VVFLAMGRGVSPFLGNEGMKGHLISRATGTESRPAGPGKFSEAFRIAYLRRLRRMKSFALLIIVEPKST